MSKLPSIEYLRSHYDLLWDWDWLLSVAVKILLYLWCCYLCVTLLTLLTPDPATCRDITAIHCSVSKTPENCYKDSDLLDFKIMVVRTIKISSL